MGAYCEECNVWFTRERGEPCVCLGCVEFGREWEKWSDAKRIDWLFRKVKALQRQLTNALRLDVDVLKAQMKGLESSVVLREAIA